MGQAIKKDLTFTTYVVILHTWIGDDMAGPKLTKLELQIMETLWGSGPHTILAFALKQLFS